MRPETSAASFLLREEVGELEKTDLIVGTSIHRYIICALLYPTFFALALIVGSSNIKEVEHFPIIKGNITIHHIFELNFHPMFVLNCHVEAGPLSLFILSI